MGGGRKNQARSFSETYWERLRGKDHKDHSQGNSVQFYKKFTMRTVQDWRWCPERPNSPCDLNPFDHGLSATFRWKKQFSPPYEGRHWADLNISHHSMKGVTFSPPTNKSLFLCVPVAPCWPAAPLAVLVEDLRLCWELHFWLRMWEDVGCWCVRRGREVWNLIWWWKFTYCTEKIICRSEEYNRL